jgi:putative oxidoreductase
MNAMAFSDHTLAQTIGQIILGLFFWIMIVKNLRVWQFNIERTGAILPMPQFFLVVNFVLQFFAGLALMINYQVSLAAIVVIILTVLATAMFHRFWAMEDPLRNNYHMLLFFNNVAITGALIMLI